MITQKKLLADHRAMLDAKFRELYPIGRYSVYRNKDARTGGSTINYTLAWVGRRPTTHSTPCHPAVVVELDGITHRWTRYAEYNCFATTAHYIGRAKFAATCKRIGIADSIVEELFSRVDEYDA